MLSRSQAPDAPGSQFTTGARFTGRWRPGPDIPAVFGRVRGTRPLADLRQGSQTRKNSTWLMGPPPRSCIRRALVSKIVNVFGRRSPRPNHIRFLKNSGMRNPTQRNSQRSIPQARGRDGPREELKVTFEEERRIQENSAS